MNAERTISRRPLRLPALAMAASAVAAVMVQALAGPSLP